MLDFIKLDFQPLLQKIFVVLRPCCSGLFLFYFIGALGPLLLVSILNYILNSSPCCSGFILFGAIAALVLFYLGPLLLLFILN